MSTLRETFSDIADAIRDKGVTGTMTPLEMPERIAEIQTGKTVEICPENVGPYQYYMKFGAKGTTAALILNTTPYVDSTIETLDMSKLESIGTYGFYTAATNSQALKTIICPSGTVEITGTYTFQRAFNGCSALTGDIDMKFSGTAGNYAFTMAFEGSGISSLNLDFSRCALGSTSPNQLTYEICNGCENLVSADINYPDFTNTSQQSNCMTSAFANCPNLKSLKIRGMIFALQSGTPVVNCPELTSFEVPDLKWIGKKSGQSTLAVSPFISNCPKLRTMTFPSLEIISGPNTNTDGMFGQNSNLEDVYLPRCTWVDYASFNNMTIPAGKESCRIHFAASNESRIRACNNFANAFTYGSSGTQTKPTLLFDL